MDKTSIALGSWAVVLVLSAFSICQTTQERYKSGPFKGFAKEEPELNKIEIAQPFSVVVVRGAVVYSGSRPLSGAVFEIRDSAGRVFSATTDEKGAFAIPDVPPGIYTFKVTKNLFHSVVGSVVVSAKARRKHRISIQLQLGT